MLRPQLALGPDPEKAFCIKIRRCISPVCDEEILGGDV